MSKMQDTRKHMNKKKRLNIKKKFT